MKLSCVLVACNENTHYLQFWPIVKRSWWDLVGVPCVMVYVGETLPDDLKDDKAVLHFKPIPSWPTATQAQCIRLLYPALLKCDGAVMISDMDMIPMQSEFFLEEGFNTFLDNQFVSLRGIGEELKEIFMCYVGGKPQTWSELFHIKSIDDIYSTLAAWSSEFASNGQHGSLGWSTDQRILYNKVKEWTQSKPERVGLIPWTPPNYRPDRLDRGNPYEWIQWNPLLEHKIQTKVFVDFHMPPYTQFTKQIEDVLKYVLEQKKQKVLI